MTSAPHAAPAPQTFPAPQAGFVPATLGRRIGAYVIDAAVATLIAGVGVVATVILTVVVGQSSGRVAAFGVVVIGYIGTAVLALGWIIVYTVMQGGQGSIGQRMTGVQLRDEAATRERIRFGRALLRNLIWYLTCAIVVGYFTVLFDSSGRRQGWHDKVGRALVVDRKATEAIERTPVAAPSVPTANPYLPPPGAAPAPGAPPLPPAPYPGAATPPVPPAPPAPPAAPPAPPTPAGWAPPASAAPAAPVPPIGTGLISHIPGVTSDPAPASQPAAPVAAPAPEAEDIDATRAATGLATLTWDDGSTVAVFVRTLFGRNPGPEDGAVVVAVRDETLSLSKTHFEIDGADGALWVVDRHSTNGTVLIRDAGRQQLAPGARTDLRVGDRLELGDRFLTVSTVA